MPTYENYLRNKYCIAYLPRNLDIIKVVILISYSDAMLTYVYTRYSLARVFTVQAVQLVDIFRKRLRHAIVYLSDPNVYRMSPRCAIVCPNIQNVRTMLFGHYYAS